MVEINSIFFILFSNMLFLVYKSLVIILKTVKEDSYNLFLYKFMLVLKKFSIKARS
jgi:hypothetical protein